MKGIGKDVTGVLGDAANLDDLDRLYETVRKEKGKIDILFASAGRGELAAIGEVSEEHFDKIVGLNVRECSSRYRRLFRCLTTVAPSF